MNEYFDLPCEPLQKISRLLEDRQRINIARMLSEDHVIALDVFGRLSQFTWNNGSNGMLERALLMIAEQYCSNGFTVEHFIEEARRCFVQVEDDTEDPEF